MANPKIHKNDDLRKMSDEDREKLLKKTLAALAHQRLRVKTNEDKKSDTVSKLKAQVARIKTLQNQPKPKNNEK